MPKGTPITPSAVRQLIENQIATVLGPSGWTRSNYALALFDDESRHLMAKGYTVGLRGTDAVEGYGQRLADGAYVTTTVTVGFSRNLRGGAHVADYDAALDMEQDLVAAVMAVDKSDISIGLAQVAARGIDGEGKWFVGEIRFEVAHLYPLT